jgi:hypothetical protein
MLHAGMEFNLISGDMPVDGLVSGKLSSLIPAIVWLWVCAGKTEWIP